MNNYLCEVLSSVPFRKWVEAEGPSQAAARFIEGYGVGTFTVRVDLEIRDFRFKVTTAIGQPTSVRWIRKWSEL